MAYAQHDDDNVLMPEFYGASEAVEEQQPTKLVEKKREERVFKYTDQLEKNALWFCQYCRGVFR